MKSNSVKLDSPRKWQTIGSFESSSCGQECTRKTGELGDVCNECALAMITKTPVPRVTETQAEEKLAIVFRRDGTFQIRVYFRVPVLHFVCTPVHKVCFCGFP